MQLHNFFTLILAFLTLSISAQNAPRAIPASGKPVIKRLNTNVNSSAADYGAVRYGDRVYFTAAMPASNGAEPVSRICAFTPGSKAMPDDAINLDRRSAHISNLALMPDASRIYFTVCRDEAQEKCEIWSRVRKYEGGWGAAEKLPDGINLKGYTATQPSVGYDVAKKQYVLYFVSNRPGGMGKKDIWSSNITFDGKFEAPKALPCNSAQDDVTPYYHASGQALYFSSNGRKGNGRFDVFKAEKLENGNWTSPANLGRPVNTAYDDLYFTLHESTGNGYLSSDRPGSICTDATEGQRCYDLYEVLNLENIMAPQKAREIVFIND